MVIRQRAPEPFPELRHHEGSWVVTKLSTGDVFETFERIVAMRAHNHPDYTVVTIGNHLARINAEIRSGQHGDHRNRT